MEQSSTRLIPLTQGKFAVVDAADYDGFMAHPYAWVARRNGAVWYAAAQNQPRFGIRVPAVFMHRLVIGAGRGEIVDHIDGDGLNNTRANLRLATPSQNAANSRKGKGRTSQYKGVTKVKGYDRWTALIVVEGKKHFLGNYRTEIEAARVYDAAARNAFGEFARTNF